ncbi:hypothetical protein CDD82_5927 [Ophiocordyceps australis]|uniref:rRNA biogenesis protein RRP5 n=1 Tax=Ophiocordyceps australis TaxID=1399860 RepID=A0A2C5XHG1_9HYPO|nr:hypothetical protein CDD82_5927 [Ophiocordyceps australis]
MSGLKRKDAPGKTQPPSKSAKKFKESRPSKTPSTSAASKPAATAPQTTISLLKNEEAIFPRGGGSVLTPLEQKQIQLDAKADAQQEEFEVTEKAQKRTRRKQSLLAASKSGLLRDKESSVRVESLSFKRLVKGSLVLVQVTQINSLNLQVSLPNNLTGHVSIAAISHQLSSRLQNHVSDDDDEPHEISSSEDDVHLKSLFYIGQYLRAHVVSMVEESATGKERRNIELSLRPPEANFGLDKDDIVVNSTVMASIVSVEDRGCIMDLGIPQLGGFLSSAEIDPDINPAQVQPGAVFLCHVLGKKSKGRVAQLSLLNKKLANAKNVPEATTINTFLPGTPASVIVSGIDPRGLSGKVMGHLDVTADLIHSGAGPDATDLESQYKIGTKIHARIICNFPTAKQPKLGISLLSHVTSLSTRRVAPHDHQLPTALLPISSLVEKCVVRRVDPSIGLFVDTGVAHLCGFVHISRVKDGKVEALYQTSGPYKIGSVHNGRVIGYSELDGLLHLSFEKTILEQQYIRLQDVPVGSILTVEIEKVLINERGVGGLIVKIAQGITGLVPEHHMADIRLQHPEKKFREGVKVKARVLSVNPHRKQIRLTLKKTLVNSEAPVIQSFDQVVVGMQVPGSIVSLQQNGALIQFYGNLRGFLPTSEMSEAYIKDPAQHFSLGQVVSVHVLEADPDKNRLVVSCKYPAAFGLEKQIALKNLRLGELVSAKVTQKTDDQVMVELVDSGLKAILPIGQLTDKSASKNESAFKRIHTGQTLSDLVVMDKDDNRRTIFLSQKPSFVEASREKKLLSDFDDAKVGSVYPAFINNITQTAVFVQFLGGLYALLPKSRLSSEAQSQSHFGLRKNGSIKVTITSIIQDMRRLLVAPASADADTRQTSETDKNEAASLTDKLTLGSTVQVKITSVKPTQLNVQLLGHSMQGRVDVSQVFDEWDDIEDPKKPLAKFHRGQELTAKVIGVHDIKDHRFLPISHRSAHSTLELTIKPSDMESGTKTPTPLSLDTIKVGDSHIVFVNNVMPRLLWVTLSPKVRGRIFAMEASDDLSLVNDLAANFAVGSALRARTTQIDASNSRVDLTATSPTSSTTVTWSSLKPGMVLAGRITKVNERQILVKLSDDVVGPVHLPDMADDYETINTTAMNKYDIVRVSVVQVDASNKKLRLSLRPSRIMSSTLPVVDREITSIDQLSPGHLVRGFVKNICEKGVFVLLGGQITALVKISNISDRFIKEWKDEFQIDQLLKGRIVAVDTALNQVELSLKASVVDENYARPLLLGDLKPGQVVTGKVRKVEVFGAFIVVDKSANVSGLCHRSKMAEQPVQDATKLYKEGDAVKARVLDIDMERNRISFGLKPSLFEDEDTDMDSDAGAALDKDEGEDDEDSDSDDEQGANIRIMGTDNLEDSDSDEKDDDEKQGEDSGDGDDEVMKDAPSNKFDGLSVGKKAAWLADPFDESDSASENESGKRPGTDKKKKRSKAEIDVDRTAELDARGPQTSSDYERLLLGQPDSSELWIAYMAFQMQVSELTKAREVAERALKSINIREETEKLNVWIAYLNLEVAYGSKHTVQEVFGRACQVNDEQEVYEGLGSIYIQSEKFKDANELFEAMVKKFGAKSPNVWMNYAHFVHTTLNEAERARKLLARATQQLDKRHHPSLMSRFAALEFRSPNGLAERGRTMFEGLLATFPKKGDLWNQLLDLEMGMAGKNGVEVAAVRDVFERRTRVKGLKAQQAEKWFRRWAAWEESMDSKGGRDRVMAKAQDWAAAYKERKDGKADVAMED